MALRIARTYQSLGGVLHLNFPVKKVLVENRKVTGVLLMDDKKQPADFLICACDTDFTFRELLGKTYMPKSLQKLYAVRALYPVTSGFQLAFAVEGKFEALQGTQVFPCEAISIAGSTFAGFFAPPGDFAVLVHRPQYWKFPSKVPDLQPTLVLRKSLCPRDHNYWNPLHFYMPFTDLDYEPFPRPHSRSRNS